MLYLNTNGNGESDAPLAILLYHAGLGIHQSSGSRVCCTGQLSNAPAILQLSLHGGLEAIEAQWRCFERLADCKVVFTSGAAISAGEIGSLNCEASPEIAQGSRTLQSTDR